MVVFEGQRRAGWGWGSFTELQPGLHTWISLLRGSVDRLALTIAPQQKRRWKAIKEEWILGLLGIVPWTGGMIP